MFQSILLFSLCALSVTSKPIGNDTHPSLSAVYHNATYGSKNLLSPISTTLPSTRFSQLASGEHPCLETSQIPHAVCHLPRSVPAAGRPMHTNKFHQNFMMGHQNQTVFAQPYAVRYQDGTFGDRKDWGLGVEHLEANELTLVKRPDSVAPAEADLIIHAVLKPAMLTYSAVEFTTESPPFFDTDGLTNGFCTNITLSIGKNTSYIRSPVCQGMGFVTAIYSGLTPRLEVWNSPGRNGQIPKPTITAGKRDGGKDFTKMKFQTSSGYDLVLYFFSLAGAGRDEFQLRQEQDNTVVSMGSQFDGYIQMGKISKYSGNKLEDERIYDIAAGWYPTTATLSLQVNGIAGSYRIIYSTETDVLHGEPLIFALPHHTDTSSNFTRSRTTSLSLESRTLGSMKAILSNILEMQANDLPVDIGFGLNAKINANDKMAIKGAIEHEMAQSLDAATGMGTYSNGKRLHRSANICAAALEIGELELAKRCLKKLKSAFVPFAENKQPTKLLYDATFGGIVSSDYFSPVYINRSQDERVNGDFGNLFYNDHHFHYGYPIKAAATIGHLDSKLNNGSTAWIEANSEYVHTLIRDFANPSAEDSVFPEFRNFDWFTGHSWANGLFEFADGRNEESSSEDYNSVYAIKLWGKVTGDSAMEDRSNLMLAVLRDSIQRYFFPGSDLSIHPEEVKANMVTGVSWQNKIEYSTFFGPNREFVNGIHMIPVTPITPFIRTPEFSEKEWQEVFDKKVPDNAWKSIIYMSVATFDPYTAWAFFSDEGFDYHCLDDGLSRSEALTFAAGQKARMEGLV